jgi:hypothetical protein
MVVTEQTGWTFKGYMQWSTPEGPLQDDLVEAFTPDGTLVDPVTLDYCYAEHGQGYRPTCALLQKEA